MRSAQCASAPSHPFHVMPSRITRNSYRPRASYRTMVASEATSALAALSQLDSMSPSAEKLTRMDNKPNFSREVKLQWAGSRETTSTSGRGGTFFLTSLFIELIDCNRRGASSRLRACPHLQTASKTPVGPHCQCHGAGSRHLFPYKVAYPGIKPDRLWFMQV